MSRPLRLEFPGAWWHIHSRGVERRDIFLDDADRRTFLKTLADAVPRFRWRLHAYVLMNNHYHLLVETIDATLSRGMQRIGGDYAETFNKRHDRVGHLFQGRFRAHLIDSETYLLRVARYIVRNPVRAGLVARAAEWPWSSHRATAGLERTGSWLTTSAILDRLDARDLAFAMIAYRQFVDDVPDAESPWKHLVGQLYLGGPDFVSRMQARIDERQRSDQHPRGQRILQCATVDAVRRAVVSVTGEAPTKSASPRARIAYAAIARSETLASLREIGATLGIGPAGAKYLIDQGEDPRFAALLETLRLKIRN